MDAVDRVRAFDNTFRASQTGGAVRVWDFETPAVLAATEGETYKAALSTVASQLCSGDILAIPTMCSAELTDGVPTSVAGDPYVVLNFSLHEVQPAKVLLRYSPGDTITGESFSRTTTAMYRNSAGLLATAGINVKRDAHYDVSDLVPNSPSLLLEGARTNIALWNRDLTNAAWTKTNMTATKNQVGADGAVNGATALTATAANATCTQLVGPLASSARFMSAYVFRGIGTGPVQMTTDAGATWTPVTLGAVGVYVRVTIPTQTLADPNFGFRIVTSGDAIGVDFVQNENGIFETSPIPTTTVAVARTADSYSLPFATPPQEMTVYAKFIERGSIQAAPARLFQIGAAAAGAPLFAVFVSSGAYKLQYSSGAGFVESAAGASPVRGDTDEIAARLSGDGSVAIAQSINSAATTIGTQSAALTLVAAWSGQLAWLNSVGTTGVGFAAFKSFKIVAGARSLAEMRTL